MERSGTCMTALLKAAGCVVIALVFSANCFAADFPGRMESAKKSEKEGLGREQVPLLKRAPGPGKEACVDKIIRQFSTSKTSISTTGTAKRELKRNRISITGTGWYLEVFGDGTKVRYRNLAMLESQMKTKPVSERLSNQKLEELGLQFINNKLSEYVKLGKGEEFVPFFTQHAIGGGGSTTEGTSRDPEKVYMSTVVFTRAIDKVMLIGPGSKIAIIFDNDGVPAGFDFDWPQYSPTGEQQKVLPVDAIRTRVKGLASVNMDSPGISMKRFNCGLFDPGLRKYDPNSVVQAACSVEYINKTIVDPKIHEQDESSGHVMAGYIDFIPAGERVVPDAKWPHALMLLGKMPAGTAMAPVDGPKLK